MTIEEILQKYPHIDINRSGGDDSFQEDKPIIERDPVAVIIKHPTEDKYLIAKWKSSVWNGFLTGGLDDGDTVESAVRREVLEETGYSDIARVIETDCVSHSVFFHTVKQVNRLAHYHLVIAVLGSLAQSEVSEEEKQIADFVWHDENEVAGLLSRNDMKILWDYFMSKKADLVG